MRNIHWFLCGLLTVLFVVSSLPAETKTDKASARNKAGRKAARDAAKEEPPAAAPAGVPPGKEPLPAPWADLASATSMTEKQQAQVRKILERKAAALAAFDKRAEAQIGRAQEAMSKAKTEAEQKRIQAGIDAIQRQREQVEAGYDRQCLAVLTPKQRGDYFGPKLWEQVSATFEGVKLSGQQEQAARQICGAAAGRLTGPDGKADEGLLNSIREQIFVRVLDRKQQEKLKAKLTGKEEPKAGKNKQKQPK